MGILGPCIYQESDARTIYFPDEADTSQRLFKRMNAECKGKSISQQVDVVILGDTTRMPNGDENKNEAVTQRSEGVDKVGSFLVLDAKLIARVVIVCLS